jgi:hypothetical protein
MKIERFEIDSWGCVKLETSGNGKSMTHEYNGVPKKLILKLLQAKSAPDTSDFDNWMKEYRAKLDAKNSYPPFGCTWWDSNFD